MAAKRKTKHPAKPREDLSAPSKWRLQHSDIGPAARVADIAGIGVDLIQKQKPGRHGTQPDRAIGARQHQNAAGEFLGQHGIAAVARAGRRHAFPQRGCFLQQWVNALAGETFGEFDGGLHRQHRRRDVMQNIPAASPA